MDVWCRHRKQTSPRQDEKGEYSRCLDFGKRIPWSWTDEVSIRSPRMLQSRAQSAYGKTANVAMKVR